MKKLFNILLVILFSISALGAPKERTEKAVKGGGSDGGQFEFFYTSISHLNKAIIKLSSALASMTEEEQNYINNRYKVKINWAEFIDVLKEPEVKTTLNVVGINPSGIQENKLMHYDLKRRKIIALQPFFKKYDKSVLTQEETLQISLGLLHEVSHVFGLGISNINGNPDMISKDFSKVLYSVLYPYLASCGVSGSIEEREEQCEMSKPVSTYSAIPYNWKLVSYLINHSQPEQSFSVFRETISGTIITGNINGLSDRAQWAPHLCQSSMPLVFSKLGNWRLPTDREALELIRAFNQPVNVAKQTSQSLSVENSFTNQIMDQKVRSNGIEKNIINIEKCIVSDNGNIFCQSGLITNFYERGGFINNEDLNKSNVSTICILNNTGINEIIRMNSTRNVKPFPKHPKSKSLIDVLTDTFIRLKK